jgi:hypothetical protein
MTDEEQITSHQVIVSLRVACATIGSAQLGFELEEIGTHSLRSGAAMEMYLAGVPVYTIMLIGRWSSDAFLRYIRRQVEQFSDAYIVSNDTRLGAARRIEQRSPAAESPRQRRDEEEYWTRRVSSSSATGLLSLQLIH